MLKKIRISLSFCLFIFFVLGNLTLAYALKPKDKKAPVEVKAQVDKSSVAIGDKVRYSVCVSAKKDIEVEMPHFGQNFGNFAIKDFGNKARFSWWGLKKITDWYLLDTYVTGKTTIPKATIKYRKKGESDWQEAETEELVIEVKSILDKSGFIASMRDIKGPVVLPGAFKGYIILGIIVLVLLVVFAGFFIYRNKKIASTAVPVKPAYEIAYEELNNLKSRNLIEKGQIKEYYFEISNIIRRYLENRFNLKAPEMTTEEFLLNAKDSSQLKREYKDSLREFLVSCDLVKFAKYAPSKEEIESIFESARNFISYTKEQNEIS